MSKKPDPNDVDVHFRMPQRLVDRIDRAAKRAGGISRSAWARDRMNAVAKRELGEDSKRKGQHDRP